MTAGMLLLGFIILIIVVLVLSFFWDHIKAIAPEIFETVANVFWCIATISLVLILVGFLAFVVILLWDVPLGMGLAK